jgi:hypothetical protein
MLSRAVSVIRGSSLIINLPGSPKAVKEALSAVSGALRHGLDVLTGPPVDCGRPACTERTPIAEESSLIFTKRERKRVTSCPSERLY